GDDFLLLKSKQGSTIRASVAVVSEGNVSLMSEDEQSLSVQIDRLSPRSQAAVMEQWFDSQDREQFRRIRQHLPSLENRPDAVGDILLEIHKAIPESPYAGLWASVAFSRGVNDLVVAKKMIIQTIDRIENQQKYNPGRHRMTHVSALNNYGIIAMKQTGSDAAAGQLIQALKHSSIASPAVRHNGEQLLNIGPDAVTRLQLNKNFRRKLTKSFAGAEVNRSGLRLPTGWYYSLDVDVPKDRLGSAQRMEGLESPHPALQLSGMASGFVASPGLVLTSDELLRSTTAGRTLLLTVGSQSSGQLKSLPVKTCLTAQPTVTVSSGVLSNTSFGAILTTRFSYFRPTINSAERHVVGLHIPGLDLKPLPIVRDTIPADSALDLYGYLRGSIEGETDLRRVPGRVSGQRSRTHGVLASHEVVGGQVGGPLINSKGEVGGMVFDYAADATQNGCQVFSGQVIHSWFNRFVPIASLKDSDDPKAEWGRPAESVVPVFAWGLKNNMSPLSQMSDGVGAGESLYLRDPWCMACGGRGFHVCQNCRGNGTVATKEAREVAMNPLTGRPVYGSATVQVRCKACGAKGGFDCTECVDGKYTGF
ncbi:MAG: hypothetical protein AAF664_18060, partial [Planctomycetota bacterium]